MTIKQRKKDHVELTVSGNTEYSLYTGFEAYHFRHNALPEVNFSKISTETDFLERTFSFPLFISSMTGGYTNAGAVNAIIAEFCESNNLPMGVGSQRIMLENEMAIDSFSVVRKNAPNAFIASNIGGAQLIGGLNESHLDILIESIDADAIIVHLNPLQELMQPEGDRNFRGIEEGIKKLVEDSSIPVIVKETGAGITGEVAERLLQLGVSVIDVAGAGGTSWSKVENRRASNKDPEVIFDEWGVPTLKCLIETQELRKLHDFELIASGGIRNGMDIAKALCLGATFTASAGPVIKAVVEEGRGGLERLYQKWTKQLKTILALTGCEQVKDLGLHLLYERGSKT